MDLLDAILLAIVQVLTEFLPVSSSGHLVLGQTLLGIEGSNLDFNVLVHVGTLVATLLYFSEDLIGLFASVRKELDEEIYGPASRLSLTLVLANVPAGLVGVLFQEELERIFSSGLTVCLMFFITAFVLFLTAYVSTGRDGLGLYQIPMSYGLLIGLAQAIAIVPGISRAGITISTAMFLMIRREDAGRFSFLLSIPALTGAALLKFGDLQGVSRLFEVSYLVGFLVSTIGGLAALRLLFWVVREQRFYLFSYYLCALGGVGLFAFSLAG